MRSSNAPAARMRPCAPSSRRSSPATPARSRRARGGRGGGAIRCDRALARSADRQLPHRRRARPGRHGQRVSGRARRPRVPGAGRDQADPRFSHPGRARAPAPRAPGAGRLVHPNIARLLDGGTTPEGQPYLVMEYVEGRPLMQWWAERRPPLALRLRLFQQLCLAVHHAHQNLIVHRDLKPGNVLVRADDTPVLLDFGIAKLIAPEADGERATELRAFTPDYASPEQVSGGPVTTASD